MTQPDDGKEDFWEFQRDPPGFDEAVEEFRAVMNARPRPLPPTNDEEHAAIEREAARVFSAILAKMRAEKR